jgi:hypothetical protein
LNWNPITTLRKDVPLNRQFLALWKGVICIAEYDQDEDKFYICFYPAQNASIMKVENERENKFTHWYELTCPQDY